MPERSRRRRASSIPTDKLSGDIDERAVRTPQLAEDAEMVGAFDREELAGRASGGSHFMKLD